MSLINLQYRPDGTFITNLIKFADDPDSNYITSQILAYKVGFSELGQPVFSLNGLFSNLIETVNDVIAISKEVREAVEDGAVAIVLSVENSQKIKYVLSQAIVDTARRISYTTVLAKTPIEDRDEIQAGFWRVVRDILNNHIEPNPYGKNLLEGWSVHHRPMIEALSKKKSLLIY